jgi:hypothetical protein
VVSFMVLRKTCTVVVDDDGMRSQKGSFTGSVCGAEGGFTREGVNEMSFFTY